MSQPNRGPVVIDTSVYSAGLDPRGHRLASDYAPVLEGRRVKNGHGLGHEDHEADRWVAATAIRLGVPLVAHDAIFAGVKALGLVSRLS